MKSKKSGILFLLVMLVVIFSLLLTACNESEDESDETDDTSTDTSTEIGDDPQKVDLNGAYYYDASSEEYLLTLSGNKFMLNAFDSIQNGELSKQGDDYLLTFDNSQKTAVITLLDDSAKLVYENNTYYFLNRTSYHVSFDTNGGSTENMQTVLNGKTATKPKDPTKEGYSFIAWYEDKEYTNVFSFDSELIKSDRTVYARFEKVFVGQNEYVAEFYTGDESNVLASQETVGGVLYNLPVPVKEGCEFAGWWVSDFGNPDKLTYKYDGQVLNSNTTLYAVWVGDTPLVSVSSTGVTWTANGVNNTYTISITSPSGETVSKKQGTTSYKYDFASKEAGEYRIDVSLNGKSSVLFYNNKALDRVSLFEVVEPSVLVFNPVANAKKYIITINSGNEGGTVTVENGTSTSFDFSGYKMKKGGITFTVKAVADGYVTSESSVFTFDRTLDKVSGISVDTENDRVVWNKVNNAVSYVVTVKVGDKVYTENVGGQTYCALDKYQGELTVEVYPVTNGYNSPDSVSVNYTKIKLATPANIVVNDNKITWDSVNGATGYNVIINGVSHNVATNEYVLEEGVLNTDTVDYKVAVQAVAAEAKNNSLLSEELNVKFNETGSKLYYNEGKIYWEYVFSATQYGVKVNGGDLLTVDAGTNCADVKLTQAGINTISVCSINKDGKQTAFRTLEVYAYTVFFDVRGGEALENQYLADGDKIVLPETTSEGFYFAGWYNVPNGLNNNGTKFGSEITAGKGSVVLYAEWTSKPYDVILNLNNQGTMDYEGTNYTVYYKQKYNLPVPVPNDGLKVFAGWYTEPNGQGFRYTDMEGNSIRAWNDTKNVELYPGWLNVLSYTLEANGNEYAVSKGPGINYVKNVVIPQTYEGLPVKVVDSFQGCSNLESITIPDTVYEINESTAFKNCSKLLSVNIIHVEDNNEIVYSSYDGVLIKNDSKDGNVKVVYYPTAKSGAFIIPNNVTVIPLGVFASSKLTEITIPYTVTSIEKKAFESCYKLTDVIFEKTPVPEGEETVVEKDLKIDSEAFKGCTQLESITLPARVTNFKVDSFSGCYRLQNVNVEGAGSKYTSKDGVLCDSTGSEIIYCPKGKEGVFTIPSGVSKIDESAFESCNYLTEIIIPGHVGEIGKNAFKSCIRLETVTFQGVSDDTELTVRESAFYECTKLTEITLPENLIAIEKYAFGGNRELAKVTVLSSSAELNFDNKVTSNTYGISYVKVLNLGAKVGVFDINGVFNGTNNLLEEVNVDPTNSNYLSEDGVLFNKEKTKIVYYPSGKEGDYVIPETVTEIGAGVFMKKENITKVTIGKNIESIGENAFYLCPKLTQIVFEEGGEKPLVIENGAFRSCRYVKEIKLPTRVVSIGESAFQDCTKIERFDIPEGVVSVGNKAFYACDALKIVTVPASVTKMGEYTLNADNVEVLTKMDVFADCSLLSEVDISADNANFASVDGLVYCKEEGKPTQLCFCPLNKGGVIVLPSTVTKIYDSVFYYNKVVTEIKFSEEKTTKLELGNSVFKYCSLLEKVSISGAEEMEDYMFQGCYALKEFEIPKTVTTIGKNVFTGCRSLTKITFEEGGTDDLVLFEGYKYQDSSVPQGEWYSSFYGCNYITEIVLPDRLRKIENYTFYDCSNLVSVTIPKSVSEIGEYAFNCCSALKSVTFEDGSNLSKIGSNSFSSSGLESISIPNGTTQIGASSFYYCKNLATVNIPESLVTIDSSAFYNDTALTQLNIAENSRLQNINANAFEKCTSLTELVIPASVQVIGASAFINCTSLASISFVEGSQINNIGNSAFGGTPITSFNFPVSTSTNITLGTNLFSKCRKLTDIYLSKSVTDISSVFAGCTTIQRITIDEESENFKSHETLPMILNKDGTAIQLVYGVLEAGVFEIPEGITQIGQRAFQNQVYLTSVKIPNSLKIINDYAFLNCYNVETFVFADEPQLERIGKNAFQYCTKLTSFTIPESVTTVKDYAFSNCLSLASVTVLGSFGNLEDSADLDNKPGTYLFQNCKALSSVALSDNVVVFGDHTFDACSSLAGITLPQTLTTIGNYTFRSSGLKSIVIPSSVTIIGSTSSSYSGNTFEKCYNLSKVEIKGSVTIIRPYTFLDCTSLKTIQLPGTLEEIGSSAFKNSGLLSIEIPATVKTLGTSVFQNCESLSEVIIPDDIAIPLKSSYITLPGSTFSGCTSLEEIVIPDKFTKIDSSAFAGCTSLTTVKLPADLTYFGSNAFKECASLKEIVLPANLATIGTYTFKNSGLESIELPSKVVKLNGYSSYSNVFDGCQQLSSVTFLGNVTEIGKFSFNGCTSLKTISFPDSLVKIGANAFSNSGLESITFTDKITYLGASAFANTQLTEVVISNNITSLNSSAFENCLLLTSATLPTSVKSIYSSMFAGCTSLVNVTIPDTYTSITSNAFKNCTALTEIKLPSKLTSISSGAFAFSGLTRIEIPSGVTALGTSATSTANVFEGCADLEEVVFKGNVRTFGTGVFKDCTSLTSITLPDSVTIIGNRAFENTGLTSINIPKAVKTIGVNPFIGCKDLTLITVSEENTYFKAGEDGILYNVANSLVSYPQGKEETQLILKEGTTVSNYAFENCETLKEVVLPIDMTTIPKYAFYKFTGLESIVIPSGVTVIDQYAFSECPKLKSVTLSDTLTDINIYAFKNSALESVVLTDSVVNVATGAFQGCTALTSATLNQGLETLGKDAFRGSGLTSISVPSSVSLGTYVFADCTALATVQLPEDLQTVTEGLFMGDTSLATITLPDVYEIDRYAFKESGIETIVIPDSTMSIILNTFENCTKLTSVTLPNAIESLPSSMFKGCTALKSVVIPDSVTSLGTSIFVDSGLESVTLSDGLTQIPSYAFQNCAKLSEVKFGQNITTIGARSFEGCTALKKLYVTSAIESIGAGVFNGWESDQTVYFTSSLYNSASWGTSWNTDLNANLVFDYTEESVG